MFNISLIRDYFVFVCIFGIILYYQISGNSEKKSLTIIIIIIYGIISYFYLKNKEKEVEKSIDNTINNLNAEIKDRNEIVTNDFTLATFPKKGLKFILKNQILVEILNDLLFVRLFDKARYADLIVLMDKYQKTYIYILNQRYNCYTYTPIFLDTGNAILEHMYSFVFIIPQKFNHIYGLDPIEVIDKNILRFTILRRKMTDIIESFSKKDLKIPYFPEANPQANDNPFYDKTKNLRLP